MQGRSTDGKFSPYPVCACSDTAAILVLSNVNMDQDGRYGAAVGWILQVSHSQYLIPTYPHKPFRCYAAGCPEYLNLHKIFSFSSLLLNRVEQT